MARSGLVAGLLVAVGLFLMGGPLAYILYGRLAERGLEERLTVETAVPTPGPAGLGVSPGATPVAPLEGAPGPSEAPAGEVRTLPPAPPPLVPALLLPPQAWANPEDYRPRQDLLPEDLGEFRPVGLGETWPRERALRIRIPAIGVDSEVKELRVVEVGDSRAWETPAFVVGHIPTTPDPGQPGTGWYFGHLESPIRNEGNVFFRLPEIPDLLRQGEPVFVVLETASRRFLYRVYRTEVVPQEDLVIRWDGVLPEIALVTCVPRFLYDHRLIVTARLVGVAEGRAR